MTGTRGATARRANPAQYTARFVGQFYREIPLPAGTDPDKITAANSKGVVTVTIPKAPQAMPKKIAVKPQD